MEFREVKIETDNIKVIKYEFPRCSEYVLVPDMGFGRSGGRKGKVAKDVCEVDRQKAIARIKKVSRRVALANDLCVHVTFTISDEFKKDGLSDVELWDKRFKKAMFLLRQKYPKLKYLATRELQTKTGRNAIHYHVLLNQFVSKEFLEKNCWKYGFTFFTRHENGFQAVRYVLKYITKEVGEQDFITSKGHRHKAYLSSQGLKREVGRLTKKFLIPSQCKNDFKDFIKKEGVTLWDNTMPIERYLNDEVLVYEIDSIFVMTNCNPIIPKRRVV